MVRIILIAVSLPLLICMCGNDEPGGSDAPNGSSEDDVIYAAQNGGSYFRIVADGELEWTTSGKTLMAEYTREDDRLRVLLPAMGSTHVMYFTEEEGGFRKEGGGLYSRMTVAAQMRERLTQRDVVQCQNNLRRIGQLLLMRKSAGKRITDYSGAAFLLQVAPQLSSKDLGIFWCPNAHRPGDLPEIGSDDFVQMYRMAAKNLNSLDEDSLRKMTSYAGPNWKDFPDNPMSSKSRLWACDCCKGRAPHHPGGIVVLHDSGTVEFLETADLEGQDEEQIYVGPGSGDKRLSRMIFYPKQ